MVSVNASSGYAALEKTIEEMNPWWKNAKWYDVDLDYNERVRKSPFVHRWFWILDKAIEQLVQRQGEYDVLVIAGPRRTGKTSLIKKNIENKHQLIRKNLVYLRLDEHLVRKATEDIGLREILSKVVTIFKLREPLVIFLDEASALSDWDLHVKNIIDGFTSEGRRFLLIVTGSLGLRLIRGTTNVLARRGDIPCLGGIANPATILPYKFSEYVESVKSIRTYIRFLDILKKVKREKILLNLAKSSVQDPDIQKLRIVHDNLRALLHALFNDYYLISGGFPLILYELIVKGDFKRIDRKWYDEFRGSVLQDLKYTGLREDVARYCLEYLVEINKMSPSVDLDKLESYVRAKANLSRRDLEKFRIEDYIAYLCDTFTVTKATEIAQIKGNTKIIRELKLFVVDPFIFHSLLCKDYPDPLTESKRFVEDPAKVGILAEHVVCSHFLRLTTRPILYYHIYKQDETLGEIDCICHYRDTYIPVQVKYTENEEKLRSEAGTTGEILRKLHVDSRPIIVSKSTFEIRSDYVIIPASIFLLLF